MTSAISEDVRPWLGRFNPLAILLASFAVSTAALLSADRLTPTLLIAGTLFLLPVSGLSLRRAAAKLVPLTFASVGIAVSNSIFGTVDAATATALGLRVAAMALPGVLLLSTVDPTDLADALVQVWRLPARFAYGALAAIRMLPLLSREWHAIRLARRARGVSARGNPLRAISLFGGRLFALLVGAIRRATRLAEAMDARGFDAAVPRTFARPAVLRRADHVFIATGVGLAAGAVAISVAVGSWRFLTGL
jgi:energy-coupling factor transport system permease protein